MCSTSVLSCSQLGSCGCRPRAQGDAQAENAAIDRQAPVSEVSEVQFAATVYFELVVISALEVYALLGFSGLIWRLKCHCRKGGASLELPEKQPLRECASKWGPGTVIVRKLWHNLTSWYFTAEQTASQRQMNAKTDSRKMNSPKEKEAKGKKKNHALSEARTQDLQIMRLTRCPLR